MNLWNEEILMKVERTWIDYFTILPVCMNCRTFFNLSKSICVNSGRWQKNIKQEYCDTVISSTLACCTPAPARYWGSPRNVMLTIETLSPTQTEYTNSIYLPNQNNSFQIQIEMCCNILMIALHRVIWDKLYTKKIQNIILKFVFDFLLENIFYCSWEFPWLENQHV